jgi:hypothetical protein
MNGIPRLIAPSHNLCKRLFVVAKKIDYKKYSYLSQFGAQSELENSTEKL